MGKFWSQKTLIYLSFFSSLLSDFLITCTNSCRPPRINRTLNPFVNSEWQCKNPYVSLPFMMQSCHPCDINEIYIYIINIWIIGLSLAFLLFCSNKQHIQGCGAHHLITMFQTFYTQTNFILHYWLRFRYHVPSLCLQQTTWIIDLCGFEDSLIKQISHTIHIVWKLINPIYKRGGNNSV